MNKSLKIIFGIVTIVIGLFLALRSIRIRSQSTDNILPGQEGVSFNAYFLLPGIILVLVGIVILVKRHKPKM